ncbi:hypothetical protein ACFWU3_32760 [Streptomyces sp. NPDC058685]|uniref:hypothetical protein n=1 Tax=Streptomyces sp. NPDC058685 TaxID=3346598 RepID=UPI00366A3A20
MSNEKHDAETAADEVLHEVEEAETDLDDAEGYEEEGEAGDALSPSGEAQESIHKQRRSGGH